MRWLAQHLRGYVECCPDCPVYTITIDFIVCLAGQFLESAPSWAEVVLAAQTEPIVGTYI